MGNKNVIVSMILAVLATLMVGAYISSSEREFKEKHGQPKRVLVAAKDIKELEIITPDMIEYLSIPSNYIQPFFQKQYSEVDDKLVIGNVALIPILKGEQLTLNKISNLNVRTGLSNKVAKGKRAIAVPVNDQTGVSKMIKPNDRVDVLAFVRIPLGTGLDRKEVRVILQDVLVLSLGEYVDSDIPKSIDVDPVRGKTERKLTNYTGYTTATLEVDPADAQKLAYLMADSSSGRTIYLALRNNTDKSHENLPSVELQDVLGPSRGTATVPNR